MTMFANTKIKIDKDLFERASQYAAAKKFPSIDEFVAHLIEKELATQTQEDDPQVVERLKGLGYIE
jgi:hypothetical protein